MMQVLSRPDARDSMSLPAQDIDWQRLAPGLERLRGLRLGLLLDAGCSLDLDDGCAPPWRPQPGCSSRPAPSSSPCALLTRQMLDGMDHFWRMRSLIDMRQLAPGSWTRCCPSSANGPRAPLPSMARQVFEAGAQFHATRLATVRACAPFDYVLSPVAPITAFAAELPAPTNDPLQPLEHIAFTVPFNMSGQPAASIHCGYSATGLPIGLQIAGQRFDDLGVLQIAHAFEQLRGPQRPGRSRQNEH